MQGTAGLNIRGTVMVESPQHLADALLDANERDVPVMPVGGGTYLSTGTSTDHEFIALDLSGLTGIDTYVPTDMTASFQAGTSICEVRAALAENGQELPLDLAADDAGTIGGLVATGYSGARRLGQGTLKDLLIGCEYVRGDGLLAKAGGMTVKNVSGFEISRLLHGSWGSLAVLTRVNLKVLPRPRVDRTFVWHDADLATALDRQMRLFVAYPGCIALQTSTRGEHVDTAIRFTGRESAIADYEQQLATSEGTPDAIHDDASVWIAFAATGNAPHLVASNSVEHSRELALRLNETSGITEQTVSLPLGTVRAGISPEALSAADVAGIVTGLWMIEGGDSGWKAAATIWGTEWADRAVAVSIKQQFDPAGVLNRGRLFI